MRDIRHYVKILDLRNQNCGAFRECGGLELLYLFKFNKLIKFLSMDLVEEARQCGE